MVVHVGNSSVRYEIALFKADEQQAVFGHFVHVYVDRENRRLQQLDNRFRDVVRQLVVRA